MTKKILVADDSITIQKVIFLTLAGEDYEVTTVGDGIAAIDALKMAKPDLVIADVIMPGKNGYEVCRYVKNEDKLRDVPVLLLAGAFEGIDEDKAADAGADAHIIKPFESEELKTKIKELLSGETAKASEEVAASTPEPEATPETTQKTEPEAESIAPTTTKPQVQSTPSSVEPTPAVATPAVAKETATKTATDTEPETLTETIRKAMAKEAATKEARLTTPESTATEREDASLSAPTEAQKETTATTLPGEAEPMTLTQRLRIAMAKETADKKAAEEAAKPVEATKPVEALETDNTEAIEVAEVATAPEQPAGAPASEEDKWSSEDFVDKEPQQDEGSGAENNNLKDFEDPFATNFTGLSGSSDDDIEKAAKPEEALEPETTEGPTIVSPEPTKDNREVSTEEFMGLNPTPPKEDLVEASEPEKGSEPEKASEATEEKAEPEAEPDEDDDGFLGGDDIYGYGTAADPIESDSGLIAELGDPSDIGTLGGLAALSSIDEESSKGPHPLEIPFDEAAKSEKASEPEKAVESEEPVVETKPAKEHRPVQTENSPADALAQEQAGALPISALPISKERVEEIVREIATKMIEEVVWEVIPELSEQFIKTEIIAKIKTALGKQDKT